VKPRRRARQVRRVDSDVTGRGQDGASRRSECLVTGLTEEASSTGEAMSTKPSRFRTTVIAASIVGAGLLGGAVVGTVGSASAADGTTTTPSATSSAAPQSGAAVDQSQSQRSDEHLLTGTDADKARAAALAKYPGATIQRVETDSDGVYEAHIVTADGQRLIVQMDAAYAVTGTDGGPR
jgi:hypothetical protein